MNVITKNIGRLFIVLAVAALAFCLMGCSQNSSSDKTSNSGTQSEDTSKQAAEDQSLEPIEIGKTYTYKDMNGNEYFSVAVEGVAYDKKQTAHMREYGHINDDEAIYVALLKVTNISAEPESFIPIEQAVFVKDEDGVSLSNASSGLDYGQYTCVLSGGIYDMPKGKTGKYGLILIGPKGLDKVDVELLDYGETTVPVK